MHQGKKLKQLIKNRDFSFSQVSRKLNHGSKNTIHNWFDRESLSIDMFQQLTKVFPNIMDEFPDVDWKPLSPSIKLEKEAVATQDWREKYFQLFEDYRLLSKKYTDLLEEKVKISSF